MTYMDKRYLEIADRETVRLAHATAGAPYPAYAELRAEYRTSPLTIARACEELRRRGLIRRASARRADGHIVTGKTWGSGEEITPELVWRRYRDSGYLWPDYRPAASGDAKVCAVPGCTGRVITRKPVYGWACTTCIKSGAVLSTDRVGS